MGTRPTSVRCRAAISVAALAALLITALPAATTSAQEAPPDHPDPCPQPFPVSELEEGMTASGLTVEKGTSPDSFSASVVGVIRNGIAPDVDMIIVEADSPAIQRAGGIWSGMSGSPVYADDGRLIGAVSYGLTWAASPVAGLTPAADMAELLRRPGSFSAKAAEEVELPAEIQDDLVEAGAATRKETRSGMRRLALPLAVSGLTEQRLATFTERMKKESPHAHVYPAGPAGTDDVADPGEIFPGSNFAATLSTGDVTAAGVGTTTMVCDGDRAIAFGHPFDWSGTTSMGVHAASSVLIQRDEFFGPFKVANPGGVAGTLDQDRLAGIRGILGAGPATIPVTSTVTAGDAKRTGTTQVAVQDFLPVASAYHMLGNIDRVLDKFGEGTARTRWTVQGTRASGAPFTVDVKNRYASQWDVAEEASYDPYLQVAALVLNEFEDVTINKVDFTGDVSEDYTRYSISEIQIRRPDGTYQPAPKTKPLRVVAGTRLNLRVVLAPYKNIGSPRNVDLSVVVPSRTAGSHGWVDVFGGPGDDEEDREDGESRARNFDELLDELENITPNNSVTARLNVERESDDDFELVQRSRRATVDRVVQGTAEFPIRVVAPARSKPAVVSGKRWELRTALSGGQPDRTFSFGDASAQPLMGDWNGDGKASAARFKDGKWTIRTSPDSTKTRTVTFGRAGDIAVVGDWDGDGTDDIGVYRKGRWLLRNSLSSGPADRDFTFGTSSWRPVVGDWNGSGIDTVGIFRRGEWRLRNTNSAGEPRYTFSYGRTGDVPLSGDWNRDGRDRPGLYRSGTWYHRNTITYGSSKKFTFGTADKKPVTWE
ncbi:SpoIVB peptidase S55 domain-containing protein [Phytoactinopolyspora limicola]|uniref:SpoIVB peptidase S55 domain-containing protein n=1 Tax=Phytoactinopolyspora limicola TaxID=2715536 RepID=UPI001408867C|nr:SpoIVB peptidase S55 domain-containing protein [Phytoactinopolyspora limicola]